MRKLPAACPCLAFIFSLTLVTKLVHAQTGDTIPSVGTFYLQSAGSVSVPYPYDPYYGNEPIEVLNASNRVYLIQDSPDDFAALQGFHSLARRSMAMDDLGGDSGDGSGSESFSYVVPTNGLWLELTHVSNGLAYLNLHNSTNLVYEIWSKTNLLSTAWNIELALWPTNGAVMPFTVPVLDRTDNLFIWARDWTGVTSGGNTVPEWWFWQNFGTTALSDTNLDSLNVRTLLYDYTNQIDPNPISFTIGVANNYVNTSQPTLSATVSAGTPFYYAAVVDSTNLAGATWTAYTSSNLTASLGSLQGWHQVWVGLRGRPATATPTWQWKRLKLDTLPPVLVITSPTNGTVSVPVIQLTGYSPEALAGISYDLTNALGLVTNQQVLITDQAYDTNTFEFTTNTFRAFDVAITNGLNTFTLHATDLAGNVTTTNVSFTLDYSSKTNPPVVQIAWPLNGDNLSGTNFNVSGQLSDPTATVSVQLVDTNNATNLVSGVVGRDGQFWLQNLPLHSGTNTVSVTVQDVVGNTTTTNLTLVQSPVVLTINPVVAGQVTVTGSINTSGYTVWVNGVKATDNGDGTWTAPITPITIGGGSVEAIAIPNTDNGGNGSGGSGGGSGGSGGSGNPGSPGGVQGQTLVAAPQGVFLDSYHMHQVVNSGFTPDTETNVGVTTLDWQNGAGGYGSEVGNGQLYEEDFWPVVAWPQWESPDLGMVEREWTTDDDYNYYWDITTNAGELFPVTTGEHCDVNWNYPFVEWGWQQRTADTKYKLATGGPVGSTQQNLWVISATAWAHTNAVDIRGTPIPPQQIQIGGFGHLDTNGNLYVLLPDNDPDDITPHVPNSDDCTFNVGAQKYHPYVTANCTRLDPVKINMTNCVGQKIVFQLAFDPPLPGGVLTTNQNHWYLPPDYVNAYEWFQPDDSSLTNPANGNYYLTTCDPAQTNWSRYAYGIDFPYCVNYLQSSWPLAQPETGAWWISGGAKAVKCYPKLTFNNGQTVSFSVQGNLYMYRPIISDFVDNPPAYATNCDGWLQLGDNNAVGEMSYQVFVFSTFSGRADITQLINRDAANGSITSQGTGGTYWLDSHRFYNSQDNDPGGPRSMRANTEAELDFSDSPGIVEISSIFTANVHITDQFQDYVVFRPDAGTAADNIYVTLGIVRGGQPSWGWSSASTYSGGVWSTPTTPTNSVTRPDWPDNSDTFPTWIHLFNNKL